MANYVQNLPQNDLKYSASKSTMPCLLITLSCERSIENNIHNIIGLKADQV